mmetsp:Transcript_78515/g.153596  ORF Transcript_78515/g.153596 Transcript_78515/m.153596 type:complete len:196 (+) Transcript_78515:140-727(+)
MSLYEVLGASRYADETTLRERYLASARLHHPDRTRGGAHATFTAIQAAWDTLSDPVKKKKYDVTLDAAAAAAPRREAVASQGSVDSPNGGVHLSVPRPVPVAAWADIELVEMARDGDLFSYECRCGDSFEVSADELVGSVEEADADAARRERGESERAEAVRAYYLPCGGCSLQIRLTVPGTFLGHEVLSGVPGS